MTPPAEATHVMRVTVPLRLDPDYPHPDFDAIRDAIQLSMAISRAAYVGHICAEVEVAISEAGGQGP